ncbi:hypothetical protein [Hymenobacter sp. BT491]|uniref:hypothetical protein n=1 Tax=Hymenobacter sp. BT491 TaxID=2766779 RepID=UPI0021CCC89D|nr:hypothetical protein [Hymenobacter sp. BT491]
MSCLETIADVYRQATQEPQVGLCYTTNLAWQLSGLSIPPRMLSMNYGCGSTVNPRDLTNSLAVLYVGVGGGMEPLQFACFSRRPGAVISVDVVSEMLDASRENMQTAEAQNDWFKSRFIDLRAGDALHPACGRQKRGRGRPKLSF